ncbi:MAG: XdhC family protein [Steroidobacteraceae bacterium]
MSTPCRSWPSGTAQVITYDTRGSDDLLWGLGVGCEGLMQILLLRTGPENDWQPLELFVSAHRRHERVVVGVVIASPDPAWPPGSIVLPEGQAGGQPVPLPWRDAVQGLLGRALDTRRPCVLGGNLEPLRVLAIPLALPPRLLLLGGGTGRPAPGGHRRPHGLAHHRLRSPAGVLPRQAASPRPNRFCWGDPRRWPRTVDLNRYDAAVVMSHHLPSDLAYLRSLSATGIRYVGLLGPARRRDKLLADLGEDAAALTGRLRSPIGLNIGGRSPESIALSIIAEIHGRFTGTVP